MNQHTKSTLAALLSLTLVASSATAQTFVPKWTNTAVFGVNQQFVNDGAYNPTTGHLIVCQSSPNIISICSTNDGSSLGTVNTTGLTGPTYPVAGLAVDSLGEIFTSTYGAVASGNKVNYWANETASPVQLISTTLGAGSVGKTMGQFGTGTNSIFILSSSTTGAVYVYNNAGTWAAKTLTVANLTVQGGITILSWTPTACVFLTKNSSASGNSNFFNPSSASPIAVTQTAFTSAPMTFVSLTATTTTPQGANGYDFSTGLFAFHTRSLTASPFTISNYLVTTLTNGLAAPNGCSPIVARIGTATTAADTANYGADFWGNGTYYCAPATVATGYGFRAFDISAYKITDTTPAAQTKNIADTATFSVVSGGSGTLAYAWKHNGNAISDGGDFVGTTNATLTISPIASGDAGTYTCTVTGAGGLTWTSTNGVLTVNLPAATNTVALTAGASPSTYGDSLTFTATIAGGGSTPTGSVTFNDGATPIATNTLTGSGSSATASLVTAALGAEVHSITSVYSGDGNYPSNTSSTLSQTVNALPVVLIGTRPYDGTANAASGILTVTNAINPDVVTAASGSATLAGIGLGTNAITSVGTLTLGGAAAANYTLLGAIGSVVITNPHTPFSVTFSYIDNTGTNFVLVWDSIPGAVYNIFESTDLTSWMNVGSPVTASGVSTSTNIPVNNASAQTFFDVSY